MINPDSYNRLDGYIEKGYIDDYLFSALTNLKLFENNKNPEYLNNSKFFIKQESEKLRKVDFLGLQNTISGKVIKAIQENVFYAEEQLVNRHIYDSNCYNCIECASYLSAWLFADIKEHYDELITTLNQDSGRLLFVLK